MGIRQNKDGTYAIIGKYKNIEGKWISYHRHSGKCGIKSKKEAIRLDKEFRDKHNYSAEDILLTSNITFLELTEMYTEHSKLYLKQSTIDTDKTIFKLYKELNSYLVEQINYNIIKRFIIKLFNQNYSMNYFDKIYFTLGKLFKYAVTEGIIKQSPMDRMQKPKRPDVIEDKTLKYWIPTEFNTFISVIDDLKHKTLFTTLYYSGMRKGELQALQWKDLDFKSKTISIYKTLYEGKNTSNGSTWELTTPKTKNSVRDIRVDDNTLVLLKNLYQQEILEDNFNEEFFIFNNYRPMPSTSLNRIFKNYIKFSGVNNINLHGIRHSLVSALANSGIDIYAIASRIGDTINQTLQTYTHFFADRQDEVIEAINKSHFNNGLDNDNSSSFSPKELNEIEKVLQNNRKKEDSYEKRYN